MIAAKTLIATAALALALPSFAGTTLLNFETVSRTTTALSATNPYAPQVSFGVNAWSTASKKAKVDPGGGDFYRGLVDGKTLNRGALALFDGTTVTQQSEI